ncbi:PQQ-binding-like beta-propeller repeat protein [Pseudonocardia sp. NPDC046786]|uniref:outer membrane protein assembly factor BamB family protein n=1 Tax=Pseudonocardia sp. NPDC046786 TaxID=3155471 RepID=UPI0033E65D38
MLPYQFAHISDLHLGAGPDAGSFYPDAVELGTASSLLDVLGKIARAEPEVRSVIATGDLTDMGTDSEYAEFHEVRQQSPLPFHVIPGNHDHLDGRIVSRVTRTGYALHDANPVAYERHLGPRWYSFDLPGIHVVAMDWHTHELGLDHETQERWIIADLAARTPGTPWMLLCHDQPWHNLLERLPSPPLLTLSGHRHTSRVVESGGTLHVNTSTPLFGGIDFSPPSFRVVTWNGERFALRTRVLDATDGSAGADRTGATSGRDVIAWRHRPIDRGRCSGVRLVDGTALLGVCHDDEPRGAVEALDVSDGSLRWRAELHSSVKGAPALHRDLAVAVEVGGDVVGLSRDDGTERWRTPSPDPLRTFAFAPPMVHRGVAVVGDLAHLRGLDADTGDLLWNRAGLMPYQSVVGQAAPVASGSVVILGSWPSPSLIAVDVATGSTVWPQAGGEPSELEVGFAGSEATVATPLVDDKSGDLVICGLGSLARISVHDGTTLWRRPTFLPWNMASPISTDVGIAVVDPGVGVVMVDRETGSSVWTTRLDGVAPLALSSYRRTPQYLFASPTLLGTNIAVPSVGGRLHLLAVEDGRPVDELDLGVSLVAGVVADGEHVLATGADGSVLGLGGLR